LISNAISLFFMVRGIGTAEQNTPSYKPKVIFYPTNGGKHIIRRESTVVDGDTVDTIVTDRKWTIKKGERFRALVTYGYFPQRADSSRPELYPEFIGYGVDITDRSPWFASFDFDTDTVPTRPNEMTRVPLHYIVRIPVTDTSMIDCRLDTAIWVYE
jgi:hypothetical protein